MLREILRRFGKLLFYYVYLCGVSLFLMVPVRGLGELVILLAGDAGAGTVVMVAAYGLLLPAAAFVMGRLATGTGRRWADFVTAALFIATVWTVTFLGNRAQVPAALVAFMPVASLVAAIRAWPALGPWLVGGVVALSLGLMLWGMDMGRRDDRVWPRGPRRRPHK